MAKLTPLMQQYWDIKKDHKDKVLLFRMGDFFEMFHDDAVTAAPILNIALTSRNKKSQDDTPMCGMPHHSIAGPIAKLLSAGHKVAICEQLEDPSEAKGIVKRGVVRILSPGMVYDPDTLDELSANFLASFDESSVSFLDASTGESLIYKIESQNDLKQLLNLLSPIELVLSSKQRVQDISFVPQETHLSVHDRVEYDWPKRFLGLPESAYRLLTYAVSMQGPELLSTVREFSYRRLSEAMRLPQSVVKHLELFVSYRGELKGSLFFSVNRTKSSAGARMLKKWLQFPLLDIEKIQERHQRVEAWTQNTLELKNLRKCFSQMGDIERRLGKLASSTCHPRDLIALCHSLEVGISVSNRCPRILKNDLEQVQFLIEKIRQQIIDEPPLQIKNGGYMAKGFNNELDELIQLAENSSQLVVDLESREKASTQIPSLKVRYNNIFGYYLEVTNTHKDKVPKHYMRKQTLTNAERYTTDELNALESKVLSAKTKRLQLEDALFNDLKKEVLRCASLLLRVADHWSELDVILAFAWLALEQNYKKPQVMSDGPLVLKACRHPVVEQEVKKSFVPNTIKMSQGDCILLTGPNMAGKSTIMRQVAVNVLLAQVGSFIPAESAEVPVFQNIFTRIGASDYLSEGLSTFMVEMQETASILNSLTGRSLLVLDEIGRGTSTYDGMSLAQSILEYIVQKSEASTLFATHYHELTELATRYPQIHNKHMSIRDSENKIEFLHLLKEGPANKSYGLHVAELAGIPDSVIRRAAELLKGFESNTESLLAANKGSEQLSLSLPVAESQEGEFLKKLKEIRTESMTPIEALNKLSQWQQDLS